MSKDYQFPTNRYYYITKFIYVNLGLPDEPPYTWGKDTYYKLIGVDIFGTFDTYDYKKNQYVFTALSADFTTNTIKILELENMLIMFDYLIGKRKLLSSFNYEKLMYERELIIKEINELRNSSELVINGYDGELYPEKTYISSGYYRAKRRYKEAIRRKRQN